MTSTKAKAASAAEKVTADAMAAALKLVTTATETAARLAATATDTAANLAKHEAVCVERQNSAVDRYNSVRSDIKGLRSIILWGGGLAVTATGVLILALAAVAWSFFKKSLGLP